MTKLDYLTLDADVVELLKNSFAELINTERVSMLIEPLVQAEVRGTRIVLTPRDSSAAEIRIFCESGVDVIYTTVGRVTSLEIPLEGKRYTDLDGPDEFVAIVRAVIDGAFKETIWANRDEQILKSIAEFRTPCGREIKIHSRHTLLSLIVRGQKIEYSYAPY